MEGVETVGLQKQNTHMSSQVSNTPEKKHL